MSGATMNPPPRNDSEQSLGALIADILGDVQSLLLQEVRLARHEMQEDLQKARQAFISLGIGIALGSVGMLLLILMLVHLLNALTELPLWACYGIVGGVIVGSGVALLLAAGRSMQHMHIVPVRAIASLKENLAWFKDLATSSRI